MHLPFDFGYWVYGWIACHIGLCLLAEKGFKIAQEGKKRINPAKCIFKFSTCTCFKSYKQMKTKKTEGLIKVTLSLSNFLFDGAIYFLYQF